jgi:hypothetical protein
MRTPLAITAVLISAAAAQAKPGPAPDAKLSPSPSEYAIAMQALGAMLESDYFKAPQASFASGKVCRMRFDYLGKERLAATCR